MKSRQQTARILVLLGLFLALVVAVPAQKMKWSYFRSDVGKVKIKFPSKPTVENKKRDFGASYEIKSEVGEKLYILNFTLHENPLSNHDELEITSLNAFAEATGGTLILQKDFKTRKIRGKEGIIEVGDDGLYIVYRVAIIGQIQYQYMVVSTMGDQNPKLERKFFKSIRLLK